MDTLKLDSTIQQLVVLRGSTKPNSSEIEYNDVYDEVICVKINQENIADTRVFICDDPEQWLLNEQSNHGTSMSFETPWTRITGPEAKLFDIFNWAHFTMGKFGGMEKLRCTGFATIDGEARIQTYLWTEKNRYSITGRINLHDPDDNYLGCIMSSRAARPGEDWSRSGDLADGPFTLETWSSIMFDILGAEFQDVNTRNRFGIRKATGSSEFPYGRDGMVVAINYGHRNEHERWFNP